MGEKKNNLGSVATLQNFSSTAKLADNEVGKMGSTGTIQEKEYSPFEHRKVDHPNSDVGSLIHLLKSSLGSGILAMPMAFKNGGLLVGAIGTFLVGFICTHCVHILVKCSHELCSRSKTPSMGFADTAGAAFKYGPEKLKGFSKFAKTFVDVALVLTYYSGNCVYVVFIADSLHQIVGAYLSDADKLNWTPAVFMWILFVPLALICQVRELKYLVPFSMLANLLIGTSLAISIYYMFRDMGDVSERELYTSIQQLPMFFTTVIFAMEGIGVVMPVENTMKKPEHFLGCPGVLNIAMATVVILYACIGFMGYLAYGSITEPSITYNLPIDEIAAKVAKVGIAVAIFFTYSLQFFVPMDITWNKVLKNHVPERFHNVTQILMRTTVVLMTVVVAVVVGDLEHLIGLVGAVFFSILGLLVPAVVETVTYWEYGLGRFNWMLIKNIALSILAIVALISGSYTSILGIIQGDKKEFVDVTLALTYYGSNCVYVVFIGEGVYELIHTYDKNTTWTSSDIMWILIIPFAIMCQLRELKYLVPFAMLANVLLAIVFVISLYYMFRDMGDVSDKKLASPVEEQPLFFSTVIFAMDGIGVVFPLENSMKHPEHFLGCPGVLNIAMSMVITLYASVGFFGYLAYGEDVEPSITFNLPDDEVAALTAKVCIIIAVLLTFCLQFFVPHEVTWRKVFEPRVPEKYVNITQITVRIVVVIISVVIAVSVGNLGYFIGFVGALSFSILGLLVPGIMETVTYWEYDLGWMRLMKNIGLMIIGLVALFTGGYTNLMGIIDSHK